MSTETAIGLAIAAVLLITILRASVKILPEYQRGVLFRLGRVTGEPRGPGLILIIPIVDRLLRVSLRTVTTASPEMTAPARATRNQGSHAGLASQSPRRSMPSPPRVNASAIQTRRPTRSLRKSAPPSVAKSG